MPPAGSPRERRQRDLLGVVLRAPLPGPAARPDRASRIPGGEHDRAHRVRGRLRRAAPGQLDRGEQASEVRRVAAYRSSDLSPAAPSRAAAAGGPATPSNRGAAGSPTNTGATASRSSSASPAARTAVSTSLRPRPAAAARPGPARSAKTSASSPPSSSGAGPPAKTAAAGSSSPRRVSTTRAGVGGRPREARSAGGSPSAPAGAGCRPALCRPRRGSRRSRPAARPPVQILGPGQDQPAPRTVVQRAVQRDRHSSAARTAGEPRRTVGPALGTRPGPEAGDTGWRCPKRSPPPGGRTGSPRLRRIPRAKEIPRGNGARRARLG